MSMQNSPPTIVAARSAASAGAGLRESVRSGRLRPGVRLPSSRALGIELGVSRRLVVEAYEQLAAEGYLVSVRGSGTRVARELAGAPEAESAAPAPPPAAAIDL